MVIKVIALDITNTILRVKGGVGSMYKAIAAQENFYLLPLTSNTATVNNNVNNKNIASRQVKTLANHNENCCCESNTIDMTFKSLFSNHWKDHPNFGYAYTSAKSWWCSLAREVLQQHGIEELSAQEYLADVIYKTFSHADAYELIPGSRECLITLKQAGYQLGVISNNDARIKSVLEELHIADMFKFILLSNEEGSAKPNTAMFAQAAKISNCEPGELLYIGDSLSKDYYPPSVSKKCRFLTGKTYVLIESQTEIIMNLDVQLILTNYTKGIHKDLDIIVRKMQMPNCDNHFMMQVLKGLRASVAMINRDQFELVINALLKVDWISYNGDIIHCYQALLYNLVSAHPGYLPAVLKSLISFFVIGDTISSSEEEKKDILSNEQAEMIHLKAHEAKMRHVHTVIKAIFKIAPSTLRLLPTIVTDLFPFYLAKKIVLQAYVQNILQLIQYIPEIRAAVLALIVQNMIKLDVRCHRERIEAAEDSDSENDMEIFDMDESEISNIEQQKSEGMKIQEADTLDLLMNLTMAYLKAVCWYSDGVRLRWEITRTIYLELLSIFEKQILPVHESTHVQFLLFYLTSFKMDLTVGYTDYLWKKVKDPNEHPLFRQEAIAYLASFLARAKHVSLKTAADCIELQCEWIHKYIGAAHRNVMQFDLLHHGPFYSVCQAMFYVLVFRQKEFTEMENAHNFFSGLGLQTIVTSMLNPLRVCFPVIVKTFASFCRKHQLAFCDAIVERNSRMMLQTETSEALTIKPHLEGYFPFDPYLLVRSSRFIDEIQREFEGNTINDLDNLSTHDDENDDFEMEEGKQSYGKSPATGSFFGSYSPGFNGIS